MNTEHEWERLYRIAVLETDWSKMEGHIRAADDAIKAKLYEFSLNHGGSPEENQAIVDAQKRLATLRSEVARWQESERAS